MNTLLDIRTIFISYSISNAICMAVMASLWRLNRKRYRGLGFWFESFIFQFLAVVLIALRGSIPDFYSIVLANTMAVSGSILLYTGMGQFLGKQSSQRFNLILLALFIIIHSYFTYVNSSLVWRSINFSVATLLICIQFAWLMFREVNPRFRSMTNWIGSLFIVYGLINILRLLPGLTISTQNDIFQSGIFTAVVNLSYQILYITLTFALFLMVNRYLVSALEQDITERKQAEELALKQSEYLRILYEASQRLNRTLDLHEIYQTICDFMSINTPNDSFVISSFDPQTKLIHCQAFWSENKWLDISDFPPIPLEEEGRGTQSPVIRTGKSMLLNDYQAYARNTAHFYFVDGEKNEIAVEAPPEDVDVVRSALIVPLKIGSVVRGTIQVMSYKKNTYTENQLKLLEALALHIASAEQNALLYKQAQMELNERKQADAALRESEVRYRMLIENVGEGIGLVNADEEFIFANPAAEVAFGVAPGKLVGHRVVDFSPLEQVSIIREQTLLRKAGERSVYEVCINTPEGESRDLLVTAVPQFDSQGRFEGTFSVFRDITLRKKAERALYEVQQLLVAEKELLSTTLMSIADGVIVTDENGRVILFNRAAEIITGYVLSEAIKRSVTDVLRLNNSSENTMIPSVFDYLLQMEKSQNKRMTDNSPVLITKTGKRILLSININSLKSADLEENTVGFVIVFQNITEKQKAEEQNVLSQKMQAIGQLAAGIAHEINTPIQYVGDNIKFLQKAYSRYTDMLAIYQDITNTGVEQPITQADLVRLDELARQKKITYYASEIPKAILESLDGTERIRKIVLAIREFSHPSEIEKKYSDINHGIETTLVISRNEWKYCADLETNFDPELPFVYCQMDEINQVILNMIINASQAIQEKLSTSSEQKGKIVISTCKNQDHILITIEDSGVGIRDENRARIFDPFFTTKGIGKGTGQGLSLAHNIIVNNHHGAIRVDSTLGTGTTFTIELPIDSSELRQ